MSDNHNNKKYEHSEMLKTFSTRLKRLHVVQPSACSSQSYRNSLLLLPWPMSVKEN